MKVGILTTQFAVNYGAILQAYALRRAVEKLNLDCEIIDYRPRNRVDGRRAAYKFGGLKVSIYSLLMLLNFSFRKSNRVKIRKFDDFLSQSCRLSKDTYWSYEDLKSGVRCYDSLVCGSDQIWNPRLFRDPAFYLQFREEIASANLIAYAPSVGEHLSSTDWDELGENVKHLDGISLREEGAAIQLSSILDREVRTTLDPVFLLELEDWAIVEEPVALSRPYILSYELLSNSNYRRLLEAKKESSGLEVVDINLKPFKKAGANRTFSSLSPGNFVWLFRNAEFVCTSSFHGTAFSILMEKQFLTAPADSRASRIENILNHLDMPERFVAGSDDICEKVCLKKIDYTRHRPLLTRLRESSVQYLLQSLKQL